MIIHSQLDVKPEIIMKRPEVQTFSRDITYRLLQTIDNPIPGVVADDTVHVQAMSRLEGFHGALGVLAEVAVDD